MKTIVFSMITFFTTVVMMSTTAYAQANTGVVRDARGDLEYCDKKATVNGTVQSSLYDKCIGDIARISGSGGSSLSSPCETSHTDFKKANEEYGKACAAFGLQPGGSPDKSCEKVVISCAENAYETEEDDDQEKGKKTLDTKRYDACPINAFKDIEFAKEQIEKLEAQETSAEEKLAQAKEKVEKTNSDIEAKEAERLQKNQEANEAYTEELKKEKLIDEQKQEELKEKLNKISEALSSIESAKADLDLQYQVDLEKIKRICIDKAEEELQARLKAEAEKAMANQLKKRNLQDQLALISKGRNQTNLDTRERAIARCRSKTENWETPVKLLNDDYKNKQAKLLQLQLQKLKDQQTAQQEATQGLPAKAQQRAKELEASYNTKLLNIKSLYDSQIGSCTGVDPTQTRALTPQTSAASACTGLKKTLALDLSQQAEFEKKLDDAKADLEYFRQLLSLATSKVKSPKGGENIDLLTAAHNYKEQTGSFLSTCKDESRYQSAWKANHKILTELDPQRTSEFTISDDPGVPGGATAATGNNSSTPTESGKDAGAAK